MSKKRKVSSFIQDLIHRGYKGHGEYGAIIRHEHERLVNVWENVRHHTTMESLAAIPPEIYHEICRLATVYTLGKFLVELFAPSGVGAQRKLTKKV